MNEREYNMNYEKKNIRACNFAGHLLVLQIFRERSHRAKKDWQGNLLSLIKT